MPEDERMKHVQNLEIVSELMKISTRGIGGFALSSIENMDNPADYGVVCCCTDPLLGPELFRLINDWSRSNLGAVEGVSLIPIPAQSKLPN